MMKRILIIDDDPNLVASLKEHFELEDFLAEGTSDPRQAMEKIGSFAPELVILDIYFGRNEHALGIDLLRDIRERWGREELPVFMITGQGDSTDLLKSMDNGANDFISKPFAARDLVERVTRTLDLEQPTGTNAECAWQERIVGKSKAMFDLAMEAWQAAHHREDVLILGETGTGKDLVARLYHRQSQWCTKLLQAIYCTNFPTDTLFESALFGHRKGSFTGATEDRIGQIQAADKGIALLNEIGEISQQQQAKLLNLLENKTIRPLGATQDIALDVVLLMATNCDLKSMVAQKEFRPDLYHRLGKCKIIEIPPLRDHLEDIPDLVAHFVAEINQTAEPRVSQVHADVLRFFQDLYWEGNIRQLRNCIQEGARCCRGGRLLLQDVQGHVARHHIRLLGWKGDASADSFDMDYKTFKQERLRKLERDYFEYHLLKNQKSRTRTAKAVGFQRRQQLNQIFKRLGIKSKQSE
jgi:DNA-binding NtrC family response regulator